VTPLQRMGHRLRLMDIGTRNPLCGQRGPEPVVDRIRVVGELRRLGGKPAPGGDDHPFRLCGDTRARPVDTSRSKWDKPRERLEQRGIALSVREAGSDRRTGQTAWWCPPHGWGW